MFRALALGRRRIWPRFKRLSMATECSRCFLDRSRTAASIELTGAISLGSVSRHVCTYFFDGPPCYITTATLPKGRMGIPFSEPLLACEACGDAPQWELTTGSLPAGLSLDQATRVIRGVPRFGSTYPFRVMLYDQETKTKRFADPAITIETRRADFDRDGDVDKVDRQVFETAFTGLIDEQKFVYLEFPI